MTNIRKKYYIQPDDLKQELLTYQTTGIASEILGKMLIQIASGLAQGPKFSERLYKEDMIGDAILRMFQNLDKIDLTHPMCNPFSYLTMICYRVYLNKSFKENKILKAIDEHAAELYNDFELAEGLYLNKDSNLNNDLFYSED